MLLLCGIIKNICERYKGSVLIEPEQAIEKADYKCGKNFYLDPILDTYKKKIIENPIVEEGEEWGDHVRVKTWMFHSRELFVLS